MSPSGSTTDLRLVPTLMLTQELHTVAKSTKSLFSAPFSSSQMASLGCCGITRGWVELREHAAKKAKKKTLSTERWTPSLQGS